MVRAITVYFLGEGYKGVTLSCRQDIAHEEGAVDAIDRIHLHAGDVAVVGKQGRGHRPYWLLDGILCIGKACWRSQFCDALSQPSVLARVVASRVRT